MLSVGIGMTQKGWYDMITTLYGVFQSLGCDDNHIIAAFPTIEEAQEILMDLYFERSYEAFCYYMKQEDVYWFCGGDKWRGVKSEVEVAMECSKYLDDDFIILEFPAFI